MSKPKPECSMSRKTNWVPPALRMWPMPGDENSMISVPNLARRVPAISFNVVNATRGLRSNPCVAPFGTRFRPRGPNVSSNGAVRRIGIGKRHEKRHPAIGDCSGAVVPNRRSAGSSLWPG